MGLASCLQGRDKAGQPVPSSLHVNEGTYSSHLFVYTLLQVVAMGAAVGPPQAEPTQARAVLALGGQSPVQVSIKAPPVIHISNISPADGRLC